MKLIQWLQGKKTLFTLFLGGLYVAGAKLKFYELDPHVLSAFGIGSLAFLRLGVKNEIAALMDAASLPQPVAIQSQPIPPNPATPSNITKLSLLALLSAVFVAAAGCTTAIEHGNVIAVSHKFFGVDIETSSQAANSLPTIRLGAGSSRVMFIPTSTNGAVQAPRIMDAYSSKTGLNPFAADIADNFGAGDVYIGGTNDTSKAIVPSPYIPGAVTAPAPGTNAVAAVKPVFSQIPASVPLPPGLETNLTFKP